MTPETEAWSKAVMMSAVAKNMTPYIFNQFAYNMAKEADPNFTNMIPNDIWEKASRKFDWTGF